MNFKLKDKPLAVQVWIILGLIMTLCFVLVTLLFPLVIRKRLSGVMLSLSLMGFFLKAI